MFKVYQDVGFKSERKQSIKMEYWNRRNFKTLDSLLLEKWDSLGGSTLLLASDYDDTPVIFERPNGEVTGVSIRILDVLAEKMNFSYKTQRKSPDGKFYYYSSKFVSISFLSLGKYNFVRISIYKHSLSVAVRFLLSSSSCVNFIYQYRIIFV